MMSEGTLQLNYSIRIKTSNLYAFMNAAKKECAVHKSDADCILW